MWRAAAFSSSSGRARSPERGGVRAGNAAFARPQWYRYGMRAPVWAFGLLLLVPSFTLVSRTLAARPHLARPLIALHAHRFVAPHVDPPTPPRSAPGERDAVPRDSTPSAEAAPSAPLREGTRTRIGLCASLLVPDSQGKHIADLDVRTSFADGSDLLSRVNRSAAGSLPPDFAPTDLVDLHTGAPADVAHCDPPRGQCLRREAADALHALFDGMHRTIGDAGHIHSAFRAYTDQCGVFARWAYRDGQGFCTATEQSALAGHSQHQLGTAIDVFSHDWSSHGDVFRAGFGCSPGGHYLDEHSWEYGFVLPYPLAPAFRAEGSRCETRHGVHTTIDPRTGYRYEPWHVRYIGRDAAARFHAAQLASASEPTGEITLDEWLRREAGIRGDIDLPVCDGCHCGACTTLASGTHGPCGANALRLAHEGDPVDVDAQPTLREVIAENATRVRVRVSVPAGTVTQSESGDDLPAAYRLVALDGDRVIATRALSNAPAIAVWQSVQTYLPAQNGAIEMRIEVGPEHAGHPLQIALRRAGRVIEARAVQ